MTFQPTMALQLFEVHKNKPTVQALSSFILLELRRTLGQVMSWDIKENSVTGKGTFRLVFFNSEELKGTIRRVEMLNGQRSSPERWEVDDWKYVW